MKQAKKLFYELIGQRKITAGLYDYLQNQKVPLDSSDLLRWQCVLTVSALDKYIHDIVLSGMLDVFRGKNPPTKKYNAFVLDMKTFGAIQSSPFPTNEFEKAIIMAHSFLSFQYPDKIADALSYIWGESHKWRIIASKMRVPISEIDLKTKLTNIVSRRNQIVHEGDCLMAGMPLSQQQISKDDTDDVISFVTDVVEAIDLALSEYYAKIINQKTVS